LNEKEKEQLLKENEELMLDHYCSAILVILWKGKEMRFNEIYRTLISKGTILSKPTLSEHLKHLRKKKWLTRNVKGVQNVSYILHESLNRPSKSTDVENWLEESLKEKGVIFYKPSSEVKADLDIYKILGRKLKELMLRIEIEPNIQNQSLNFDNSQWRLVENDIVKKSRTDEQYRNRLIKKTEELQKLLKVWHDERLKADRDEISPIK
jgi:predicted transcriptional regulator